ncbi:hypothetical protein A2X44_02060 [candidate division CPR3 bacterium GWF2_35_18]|uniref:Uncharacterized protein n=1 Tax=candidate division CPR3 bacterium GW2011_GWF2_35_18 TaxID=1618350 RepID=A0A0G0C1K8_UNCC3|nr:MAG: hypothetical protein UR67_C0002G0096 [candidate division CPR3 bacterium GW2011_GWF2_35_18]KKP86375.1 MAG: hypothetical protein UR87_C0021G0004 [candidate division CPR3 bacterium GW2011_GWE2_35_7]OGB62784.1 MAG: hypothetical protein A2X44_02060 [candidate division CPR3 bacterium GWF2_35_18]OGB65365.1 MAG: hypothetical protein A2250_00275 [candidate division CPR3 bacterium RIFOXYA2_FULL_35_13]OGB76285.1 MAG: hypothetical protein A2476_02755 [candidate division CPR3 bacterium RIFOXYC2_FULL
MGTGILTTQIERLTQRANASGMHFHTVSSLKLLTQNQELKLFASHHKQIVESVYGHHGHGILAGQTPEEIAAEMREMKLLTWISYDETDNTPIATSSFQLTRNKLFWDVVRCAKNPQFMDFPGSITILISIRELFEHPNLVQTTIGLSAEVRTGITVVNNGYTIPGGPQMLSIAMNHLMMTAFGFEPLIATAWQVSKRVPLTEFFQISYRFWNSEALKWYSEPLYLDSENDLLATLASGIWLSNTQSYPEISSRTINNGHNQNETVIKTYGNQFAEVFPQENLNLQTLEEISERLFKNVRFIRFILKNKPQNIRLQKMLSTVGAIPTVIKPQICATILQQGKLMEIISPPEIWFGLLKPGTGRTLIPFGLSSIHDNANYKIMSQFAKEAHARFSRM